MLYDVKFTETFVSHIKVEANDEEQAREIAENIVEQGNMVEEMVSCSYEVEELRFFEKKELVTFIGQKLAEFRSENGIVGGVPNVDMWPIVVKLSDIIDAAMKDLYRQKKGGE